MNRCYVGTVYLLGSRLTRKYEVREVESHKVRAVYRSRTKAEKHVSLVNAKIDRSS